MGYWKELLANWRPILAALLGLASGFSAAGAVTSIMAPHMIKEFGWTQAQFTEVGSLSLVMTIAIPIAGRLADVFGVRRTALIGVTALPLAFIALSAQTGDIRIYMALFIAQAIICITATSTVMSRVVVQYVVGARGLALAIAASGPALSGIFAAPLLNNFVEAHGWREGYVVAAIFSASLGVAALLLMPPEKKPSGDAAAPKPVRAGLARRDYGEIFKNPAFWIMTAALLLCNLPQTIAITSLVLVLNENGASPTLVSTLISAFFFGTLAGRFMCGLSLDRFPAHIVSAIGMGLPFIGLWLLASDLDTPAALAAGVMLFGLAIGAEGDLVGFLVVRNFGVRVYSSVLGLMTAMISLSTAFGAWLLARTLEATDTFVLFLSICAVSVLVGSLLFLLLKKPAPGAVAG